MGIIGGDESAIKPYPASQEKNRSGARKRRATVGLGIVGIILVAVVVVLVIWLTTAGGAPASGESPVPLTDLSHCGPVEDNWVECRGPCAPLLGRSCVSAVTHIDGTITTWCINGPFRYPWVRYEAGTGRVKTGWRACLW